MIQLFPIIYIACKYLFVSLCSCHLSFIIVVAVRCCYSDLLLPRELELSMLYPASQAHLRELKFASYCVAGLPLKNYLHCREISGDFNCIFKRYFAKLRQMHLPNRFKRINAVMVVFRLSYCKLTGMVKTS